MIRYLMVALWAILVAIGSVYAGVQWSGADSSNVADNGPMPGLDYVKTSPISVPIIRDDKVTGYVLAQFVYTVDAQTKKDLKIPLDLFLLDESFRQIYAGETINFEQLERYDLDELTDGIRQKLNTRFKSELIREVLIEQLNFISLDMVRERLAKTPSP